MLLRSGIYSWMNTFLVSLMMPVSMSYIESGQNQDVRLMGSQIDGVEYKHHELKGCFGVLGQLRTVRAYRVLRTNVCWYRCGLKRLGLGYGCVVFGNPKIGAIILYHFL